MKRTFTILCIGLALTLSVAGCSKDKMPDVTPTPDPGLLPNAAGDMTGGTDGAGGTIPGGDVTGTAGRHNVPRANLDAAGGRDGRTGAGEVVRDTVRGAGNAIRGTVDGIGDAARDMGRDIRDAVR